VFVRICDVHSDGRSLTVCDGIRRIGSIATTVTDPQPGQDGFADVDVPLWPTFRRRCNQRRRSAQCRRLRPRDRGT
jgi:hypothetical protein